jgi:predicted ATPase/DNA-binding SARP family transcriptional activator
MRVGILGPLEVVADGEIVEVGGARLRALLIRLALDAGHIVTVESLADGLWPEDGPTDPANALQSLVSRLRRALPGEPAVRSVPGGYRLDVPPDAVDALRFERLAREGRQALKRGEAETAARLLREALGLWRGEVLAGAAQVPFAAAAAVRLSELRLTATEDRVEADLQAAPDHAQLVAELQALVAVHPLRERLRVLLVRALHADGRPAEALSAYERFRGLLADELGADPGPELRAAHLAVLRGERVPKRPDRTRPRGNLRAALTSFVGRTEEQRLIGKQFKEGRLVTLIGPGGAGKTRLATTFAAGIADQVPGGVWLVELAPVTAPGEVAQAVIDALGLREVGVLDAPATPRDAVSRLVEALSATETLIVLDNCEHLIDAAARLADDLLGRCPRLRVLATSREPLGVPGETLCPVPPLGLPQPGASADDAMVCSSVRLFADRAAAVRPDFAVTDGNVAAVAEVCRRLDGLPLAIELAAVRLRSLPLVELAARLGERFEVLTGGSRTTLPRHRTLRAVVAWSWELLDDDQRRLARRLTVFPATFTLESAAQVCAAAPTVLDTLTALVDKSLLQVVEGPEPRYRMLETIREYGREQLAQTGEIGQLRAAHAAWFLGLAEQAEPHLRAAGQVPWIDRLVAERANLLAALHFARDTGDAQTAVRLGAALGLFWTVQGNHAEAASRLRLALEVPGPAPQQARATTTAFYLLNTVLSGGSARTQVAIDQAQARALALASAHGPAAGHPAAALIEPTLALVIDDTARGLAAADRLLSHPDPWARAMLRLTRALLDANDGDMDRMRRDLAAAVEGFRETGERWGLATSLTYLGFAQTTLGDFDGAIAALEESVRRLRELDPDDDAVLQRALIADARRQQGDVERARAELLEMVTPGTGTSSARYLVFARITLGNLARYDGDLEEAARQYEAAWQDLARAPSAPAELHPMLQVAMGHLAVARNELRAAEQHLSDALARAVEMPDMPMAAVVGVGIARLRLRDGATHAAAEVLGAAHALRGAPDAFNPDVVRLVQDLRGALGERAYRAAYARGGGLDRTAALALLEAQVRRR